MRIYGIRLGFFGDLIFYREMQLSKQAKIVRVHLRHQPLAKGNILV